MDFFFDCFIDLLIDFCIDFFIDFSEIMRTTGCPIRVYVNCPILDRPLRQRFSIPRSFGGTASSQSGCFWIFAHSQRQFEYIVQVVNGFPPSACFVYVSRIICLCVKSVKIREPTYLSIFAAVKPLASAYVNVHV